MPIRAMLYLKSALTRAPQLGIPDFSDQAAQFEVIFDASGLGIGAGLFQGDKIIAFEGRKYRPAEVNYTVGEQELLAVVHSLLVWRCYLEGAPKFKVITDHNPLIWFNTQTVLSRRQARWSEYIQRFDFEWVYRPDRMNVADPLSRAPSLQEQPPGILHDGLVLAHVSTPPSLIERLVVALTQSPVDYQQSPAITKSRVDFGQHPKGRKQFDAVCAHSWLTIIQSCRGRPQLEGGDRLRFLAARTRSGIQTGPELANLSPRRLRKRKVDGSIIPQTVVHHQETPPDNGNRFGASDDMKKGQDSLLDEVASESEEIDVTSQKESMDEQLEEHSEVQGLLTEFMDLVKEGYQQDDWFSETNHTK